MKANVVFTDELRMDLRAQTRRLIADDRSDWAERLIDEVDLAATLVAASPQAGPVETRRRGRSIRRLLLRRLPFVLWYYWHEPSRKVVVLRLFHVRQRR